MQRAKLIMGGDLLSFHSSLEAGEVCFPEERNNGGGDLANLREEKTIVSPPPKVKQSRCWKV